MNLSLAAALSSILLLDVCLGEVPAVREWSFGRIFQGGSNSIVAIAVGNAEGTRTVDGGRTSAYKGHVDPGNAKWNVGSFSYQHCSTCSPGEADARQLKRLRAQTEIVLRKHGEPMSKTELINAIDLANQSPLAALAKGGYPDRLKQAKQKGLKGSEAILWARVWSYFDPEAQKWDAPGLGNTVESIQHDQERRQVAIEKVLKKIE